MVVMRILLLWCLMTVLLTGLWCATRVHGRRRLSEEGRGSALAGVVELARRRSG